MNKVVLSASRLLICLAAASAQQCDFISLDFTNMTNPMAQYYGQNPTFQAGDYLYDQLWYSHGVKVSVRVRSTKHLSTPYPWIPLYNRGTGTWYNAKRNPVQDPRDPTTGGAMRLFDTARPTFSGSPDHNEPLCPNDEDLGAPNEDCPGGGPGRGEGGGPNSPYANCDALGLIGVIQTENKDCPDDALYGGYITFTFRQPVELQSASFLDIDDTANPVLNIYQTDKPKVAMVTETAGNNGFYKMDIDPAENSQVEMIDIFFRSSGALNSLSYRYCPELPTPEIEIRKYAGPPGSCSAGGVGNLQPVSYTVPSASDGWVYCYEISVPESSDECLYDVTMTDPAPNGVKDYIITQPSDRMCSADGPIYVEGGLGSGPEGPFDAHVSGTGYHSGILVTNWDDAEIRLRRRRRPGCGGRRRRVILYHTSGVTGLVEQPIDVVAVDNITGVTTIHWNTTAYDDVDVYIEYKDPGFNGKCGMRRRRVKVEDQDEFPNSFDIACPLNRPSALVHVTVSDPTLSSSGDTATLSACCGAPTDLNPKVKYTFLIPCKPCPYLAAQDADTPCGINLARVPGAVASQIADENGGVAARVIDGNTNGSWELKSVNQTPHLQNPWWQVVLATPSKVSKVVIYNREDCCWDRLRNVQVRLLGADGITDIAASAFYSGPASKNEVITIEFPSAVASVSAVNIMVEGTAVLNLAEVEVYYDCESSAEGDAVAAETKGRKQRGLRHEDA